MNISKLVSVFEESRNLNIADKMSKYMRYKFEFLWIQNPLRTKLEKRWFSQIDINNREDLIKITNLLWSKSEREYQYTWIELLKKYKYIRNKNSIKYFEKLILSKSWWDSVDSIDTNLIWKYLFIYPEEKCIAIEWAQSENIRLQRTAIQFQLLYKIDTDIALLENILNYTNQSNEFFVQKAMWRILREYSKTNPLRVKNYIKNNSLPKLTIREWSKYI